jgi:pseudouridine synthase
VDGQAVLQNVIVPDEAEVTYKETFVPAPKPLPRLWGLRKHAGVLCVPQDREGIKTLPTLIRGWEEADQKRYGESAVNYGLPSHFVVVGHLDIRASGMVLLTNDGDFAHNLSNPKSKLLTVYDVRVNGLYPDDHFRKWRIGVQIGEVDYGEVFVQIVNRGPRNHRLNVALVDRADRCLYKLFESRSMLLSRVAKRSFGPYRASEIHEDVVMPLRIKPILRHLVPPRDLRPSIVHTPGTMVREDGTVESVFDAIRQRSRLRDIDPEGISDTGRAQS